MIRDLYAIAAFYVANPTHPLPDVITLTSHVDSADRVAEVAEEFSARGPYGGPDRAQSDHTLIGTATHVTMIIVAA